MNITLSLLLFFICSILIGLLLRVVLKKSALLPYSVALLLAGILLGYIAKFDTQNVYLIELQSAFLVAGKLDAELILFIFLPALVFESAYSLEVHLFKRMFSQIALLAIPGLIICTILTALLVSSTLPWQWPLTTALIFGAIVSATDPVAVVALLKEMCSRARLQTLLEGESLLNDGTAIVLFTLFLSLAINVEASFVLSDVVIEFLRVVSLGAIIGAVVAFLSLHFLERVFNDSLIEITLTLVMPYLVFYLAEHIFHASGVVAVVTLALIFAGPGRTRFSPEVHEALHHFWHSLSYLFNTLIFILVGIVIASRIEEVELASWYYLLIVYIGIFVIRAFAVISMNPILSRVGIGITKEKSIVLVWGGIRGAVSMAMALIVATNSELSQVVKDQILFLTAGIVVLTIVVNGSTMSYVMAMLGLDKLPKAKQEAFAKVEDKLTKDLDTLATNLKNDPYLSAVNWSEVSVITKREKLAEHSGEQTEKNADIELLRKLLEAERQFYWNQFNEGMLSQKATHILVDAIEKALDGTPLIWPRKSINTAWQPPFWLNSTIARQTWSKNYWRQYQTICFESAKGLLNACHYLYEQITLLAPPKELKELCTSHVKQLEEMAKDKLNEIQQNDKQLTEKVESYLAARQLLNKERSLLNSLSHQGLISHSDAEKLVKQVEFKMHKLKQKS